MIWTSHVARVHGIWNSLAFYVIMLLLFFFCYGCILMTVRRQASVMAAHSGKGRSTAITQSNKIQSSVIKTMILVCTLFAVTWLPYNVLYFLMKLRLNLPILEDGYCVVLFISFLYICTNPFIYATKFEPVKRVLLRLIPTRRLQRKLSATQELVLLQRVPTSNT